MPRGQRKGRQFAAAAKELNGVASDDEYDTNDSGSIISCQSDTYSQDGDDDPEATAQENLEEKLRDAIDGFNQKNLKGRLTCLEGFRRTMSTKFMPDFIEDRKVTISEDLQKSLKKGKGEEQALSAFNLVLEVLQLGTGVDTEQMYEELKPVMSVIIQDTTASVKARGACCTALAHLTFLASLGIEHVLEMLSLMEDIFRGSFYKGNKVAPTHTPEVASLHTDALNGWCLLLTISPNHVITRIANSILGRLNELLESSYLDLRIAAGEAIALIYELMREDDEDFEGANGDDLIDKLHELSTDCNKNRTKKEKRHQRSIFRDILRTVEDGDSPSYNIKFGYESLALHKWSTKCQYDEFVQLLGPGMNVHLQQNFLLRDIFNLGSPLLAEEMCKPKSSKLERHMYNAAAFKARTKIRSKNRDKRRQGEFFDS